ncbi:MAG: ATP-binding cassette domain-containing protein [Bacillota bacterium]|nr:ATP-binding cassette domain-containing protein [Bacillota bacterium]
MVSGELLMDEVNITKASIKHRIEMGMRMVTEDPLRDNVVPGFSVLQNMALVGIPPERRRGDIDWEAMQKQFESFDSIKTLGVPASNRITRDLSGGNVQRVAFARAVISNPKLLIASYPSRGLDVATVNVVYNTLLRLKAGGTAVLLISEDLNELYAISDRIVVLAANTSFGPFDPKELDMKELGKIMLKGQEMENEDKNSSSEAAV